MPALTGRLGLAARDTLQIALASAFICQVAILVRYAAPSRRFEPESSPYDLFISLFRTAHPRYRPQPRDSPITLEMTQQNKTMNFLIHDANGKCICV